MLSHNHCASTVHGLVDVFTFTIDPSSNTANSVSITDEHFTRNNNVQQTVCHNIIDILTNVMMLYCSSVIWWCYSWEIPTKQVNYN